MRSQQTHFTMASICLFQFAQLIVRYQRIPNELKDKKGNVDLDKFKKRVSKNGKVGYEEDVTGERYVIEKDRGANSGTGEHASKWKLKTQRQFTNGKAKDDRIATLGPNGEILRG